MKERIIFYLILFNIFKLKKLKWRHFEIKDWKYGNGWDKYGYGKEIINTKNNKVVYRNGTYTETLDKSNCKWIDIKQKFIVKIKP